jgi:hypothetical protein
VVFLKRSAPVRNLPTMDFSRRRLLRTGAATATAAGAALAVGTAAHAAETDPAPAQEPLRGRETALDLEQKHVNPANLLGCPLGKGE